ncbi:class I SAM-dependent methyltransferase [Flexibacterium corallicola]|uniref:class I SAM-dependent methyltransferase n=1 Tax=Flexibacterium corallicola TaxID=3037259 RepID=UPI00286F9F86|nr:methyltransferase [Pseudovibrio sp. M1P-2-3]
MFQSSKILADSALKKILDETRFIRSWAASPLQMGAVAPSSSALSKKIASFIPDDREGDVVELGPGTGAITKEILASGTIDGPRLTCLEYSHDFCNLLRGKYPDSNIIQGDAYNLKKSLSHIRSGSLSAVVSGLPMWPRPLEDRLRCVDDALDLLKPNAPFILYTYSLSSPIPKEDHPCQQMRGAWVWRNLPPASVWVYRRVP